MKKINVSAYLNGEIQRMRGTRGGKEDIFLEFQNSQATLKLGSKTVITQSAGPSLQLFGWCLDQPRLTVAIIRSRIFQIQRETCEIEGQEFDLDSGAEVRRGR